jgi:hypothetical protein
MTGGTTIGLPGRETRSSPGPGIRLARHAQVRAAESASERPPYVDWMSLTHSGRRTPLNGGCDECGDQITDDEIAESRGQFMLGPGR